MIAKAEKHFWTMRCFYLARAAILARAAGLRESVIPLLARGGGPGIWPQPVKCFWGNRGLSCFRELGDGGFHKLILALWVAGEFGFTSGCETHEPG